MAFLRFPATMARKADAVYRVTAMTVADAEEKVTRRESAIAKVMAPFLGH